MRRGFLTRPMSRGPIRPARPRGRRSGNTPPVTTFTIVRRGPFDLATARDFAGGFPAGIGSRAGSDGSILMTFPVEGWTGSAAVQVRQAPDGSIHGDAFGDGDPATIERQAARSLPLDHDGAGWPDVGRRDPVIGRLQSGTARSDRSAFSPPTRRRHRSSSANGSRWLRPARSSSDSRPRPATRRELELDGERRTDPVSATAAASRRRRRSRASRRSRSSASTPSPAPHWRTAGHGAAPGAAGGGGAHQLRDLPGVGEWTASAVLPGAAASPTRCRSVTGSAARRSLHFHDLTGRRTTTRGRRSRNRGDRIGCGRRCSCTWRGAATAVAGRYRNPGTRQDGLARRHRDRPTDPAETLATRTRARHGTSPPNEEPTVKPTPRPDPPRPCPCPPTPQRRGDRRRVDRVAGRRCDLQPADGPGLEARGDRYLPGLRRGREPELCESSRRTSAATPSGSSAS